MAFINPNTISNISREEFEELKERVNVIDLKINSIVNPNGDSNYNIEETIINSQNEFSETNNTYEVRKDINIHGARLSGIPKIEYFNFTKKEKVNEVTEENPNSDVINLSDIINNVKENKKFTYKIENIPVVAKTSSGHRTTLMGENKISSLKDSYYGDAKKIAA